MDRNDNVRHGARGMAGVAALAICAVLLSAPIAMAGATPPPSTTPPSTTSTNAAVSDDTATDTSSSTPPDTSSSTPPDTSSSSSTPDTSSSSTPAPGTSSKPPASSHSSTSGTSRTSTSRPSSTDQPEPTHDDGDQPRLSSQDLATQIAAADELRGKLVATNLALAGLVAKLEVMAKQSNQLLETLDNARTASAAATDEAVRNEQLSAQLAAQLADERQKLRAWAFYAYSEGGSVAEMAGLFDAMRSDPSQAGNPVGDLSYLTTARAQAFEDIKRLETLQADATTRAQDARALAAAEEQKAADAKAKVDLVLTDQRTQLAALRKTQSDELAKAGPLGTMLAGSPSLAAQAAYAALLAQMQKHGQTVASIGKPCSDNDGTYPNGMLPASALCPLFGAPGASLRPKAAAAFNALSAAYAKQTGSPICVTDSYRTLTEQIAVKAKRGVFAATPGTSPHGLGIALDLCGGIDSFGSVAHLWMQQNGPAYGWYHPAWAEPGGSLPEPWHWQYAG